MTEVEPPASRGSRTFGHVEHPFVGAKRLVKPNCMVEASNDQLLGQEAVTMLVERGLEQSVVAGISKDRLVRCWIVVERTGRAKPGAVCATLWLGFQKVDVIHLSSLNRPVEQQQEIDRRVIRPLLVSPQSLFIGGHRVRRRRLGHRNLVLQPFLRRLERNRHVEDRLAVLLGNHTPRGERASVTNAVDVIDDGGRGIPLSQEVTVQRMGGPAFDGPARCDQRLRGNEATEDPRSAIVGTESAKEIDIERLEVEPFEKAVEV